MSSTGNRKKSEMNVTRAGKKLQTGRGREFEQKSSKKSAGVSEKRSGRNKDSEKQDHVRDEKKMPEKSRGAVAARRLRKLVHKHKGLIICAAVAVLAAFIISKCFVQLVLIRDVSMEPAYRNGQIVAVGKLPHDYQAGDVIVFEAPQLGCKLVKRIAHVPGDHLTPEEAAMYGKGTLAGYTLPEGAYLVLGDNAAESVDSRDPRVGVVSERQIVGVLLQ